MRRKTIKRFLSITLSILPVYGIYYCWVAFPIATGYGAKVLCSSVFLSGRNAADIESQDLDFFPVNLATFVVNVKDSSVTSSMFGFAKRKAIYRGGLGATLVNDLSEQEIRSQHFKLAVPVRINTDTIPWPMGDKLPDSFPAGIDPLQIVKAVDELFNARDTSFTNQTRALIVLYNGQIVAERYAPGFTAQTRLTGWSMTKSITGALAGILVKQHKLNVDDHPSLPQWQDNTDPRRRIRIKHLLQQTSGLEFEEVYHKPSHANRMLFMKGDAAAYAASHPLIHEPGTEFHYSSGNTNILSGIFRGILKDEYHSFPYTELFYRLGMYSAVLEPDASGTFVSSSFCYATARDWARFGLLYLNDGIFNGERILPDGWIKQSITPSTASGGEEYGFQWWLSEQEMFYADGYEGQNIFVIPSKKLVVVRLGLTRNSHWGEEKFLEQVMRSVR